MDVLRLPMTPYHQAWDIQRSLAAARAESAVPDTLILVEHPSVYTAGRRTQPWERPINGTEVIDVDRGGKITWHGPGQLVGYPVLLLPVPLDVVAYVRALEGALIASCAELGLASRRVQGRSGVWTADGRRKIAAIGVRVRRRVTYHGFALNCCPDLTAFDRIVPCGIADAAVTSLSDELGRTVGIEEALPAVERAMLTHLTTYLATGPASDRARLAPPPPGQRPHDNGPNGPHPASPRPGSTRTTTVAATSTLATMHNSGAAS